MHNPANDTGRLAGLLYLLVVITGVFALAYVPSRIPTGAGAIEALDTLVAHAWLYRAGIAAFMLMQLAFLLLPLALHRLFTAVDSRWAALMVLLALISIPLGLAALAARMDALALATDPALSSLFSRDQIAGQLQIALQSSRDLLQLTQLFWGLWLLPLGWLVIRSGRLPRVLGVLLIAGCAGYLVQVFGRLLLPAFADSFVARIAPLPAALGEIGTCLWLLLVGARAPKAEVA